MMNSINFNQNQTLSPFIIYTDYYDESIILEPIPIIKKIIIYFRLNEFLGYCNVLEIYSDYSFSLYIKIYNSNKTKFKIIKQNKLKNKLLQQVKNLYSKKNKIKSNKIKSQTSYRKFIFDNDFEKIIEFDLLDKLPKLHQDCITNLDGFINRLTF